MISHSKQPQRHATLAAAGLLCFLMSLPHAGLLLVLCSPFILLGMGYALAKAYFVPEQRKRQWQCILIWLLAVGIAIAVQGLRHWQTRQQANAIVASIEAFHTRYGRYPEDIRQIGLEQNQLTQRLGQSYYTGQYGKPSFFYASSYTAFDTEQYDFEAHCWQHHPD